jgi:hypothetical protein
MPNFLGLERWQVMYGQPDSVGALVMGLRTDLNARTYLGFNASERIDYDFRDVDAQKRLLADRVAGAGWVIPQIVEHMWRATDFHFYSLHQVRMSTWAHRRVVLLGDAGYAVSLGTGQATSVAMVGAYVLAGELATRRDDLVGALAAYEDKLRAYVFRNQDIALELSSKPDEAAGEETAPAGGIPDFGALTLPFALDDYRNLLFIMIAVLAFASSSVGCRPGSHPHATARPTCDAIDDACDPYEDTPGLAKECHDMAEASTTEEAVCVRRKTECLAACPRR